MKKILWDNSMSFGFFLGNLTITMDLGYFDNHVYFPKIKKNSELMIIASYFYSNAYAWPVESVRHNVPVTVYQSRPAKYISQEGNWSIY